VILTNFEGFDFYDASAQPDPKRPEDGLLLSLCYSDYPTNAEKLWEFSRERVAAGSLEALLPKIRRAPRLRKQVDDVFLDEMTGWREDLAKNIHKNNPDLTARQLNEVVQRLLDRIVFIRIAEDRKVLEYGQLRRVLEDWEIHGGKFHIFDWLNDLFHRVNDDFNGEIFKPHLSETIRIDSDLLARIIRRLYPPDSPYRFDVIGVELLGSIYERYLGNTIRLTPKQVKVEEKPEVRKAGGVYYTPRYVVDYIVRETVGKTIEGKSPKQIEKIRILDPACGSGSFLIGAFQYLIDYHVKWYLAHPEQEVRHAHPSLDFMREVHTDPDGAKRLSVYRKARILRNNLFGVDIDPQAVEITMMSLYLKALEGEKSQLPPKQHILPELKYNIQCGNSLIGPDIYDQGLLFAEDERDRINAFDWGFVSAVMPVSPSAIGDEAIAATNANHRARDGAAPPSIGQVVRSGGFDVVIGNPPWGYDFSEEELRYLRHAFRPIIVRMIDSFMFFVAKACSLVRKKGRAGMIVPDVMLYQVDNLRLRELLLEKFRLAVAVNLGDRVFARVTRPSCIFVVQREAGGSNQVAVFDVSSLTEDEKARSLLEGNGSKVARIKQTDISLLPAKLVPVCGTRRYTVWFRLKQDTRFATLAEFVDEDGIQRGVSPDLKEAFVVDGKQAGRSRLEKPWLRKVLLGGDIKRYRIDYADRLLLYITGSDDPKLFPHIRDFITQFKKQITCTEVRDHKHSLFALHRARGEQIFLKKTKLVGVLTEDEPILARDDDRLFATDGAYLFGVKSGVECNYVLAVMNSRLMRFLYRLVATETNRVLAQVKPAVLGTLPIPRIDVGNRGDKTRHDKMVELVDRMLELNRQKHSGKLAPSQVERVDREIAATDEDIDKLVYELYAITDAEKRIIEEG
jgi:type I restriction-modification system DNA methylase subunit